MSIIPFLPSKGLVAVVGIQDPLGDRKSYHKWIDLGRPDASEWIDGAIEQLRVSNNCEAFYWSEASYVFKNGDKLQRRADKATWFRSYVMDIDCHGKDNEWPSPRAALSHIIDFADQTGLPPTAVVFTGRGLQVIWTLTKDIKSEVWIEWADKMWSLALHFNFRADPTRRRDRASIFRMPGTENINNGQMARIIYQGKAYSPEDMDRELERIVWDFEVPPVIALDAPRTLDASEEGTVYSCEENSKRLKLLLSMIPAHFEDEVGRSGRIRRSGYELWRNVVWAAKRTGLPDAWNIVYDWALKAAPMYDTLEEGLERTWESDNMEKGAVTGPGTLYYMAKKYGTAKQRNKLMGDHFLTHAEVCQLEGLPLPAYADDRELFDYYGNLIFQENEDEIAAGGTSYAEVEDADDGYEGEADPVDPNTTIAAFQASYGEDYDSDGYFRKNVSQMPPGPFGSPVGALPDGYIRATEGAGFGYVHVTQGQDGEPIKIWRRLCYCDVEFLEQRYYLNHEGVKVQESFVFRKYNEKTGRAEPPFEVPGADLADQTTLMRLLRSKGVRYSNDKGAEGKMRAYLCDLSAEGSMQRKPTVILEQAGWINEGKDFALGQDILSLDSANVNARISETKKTLLNHVGEQAGTLEMQFKVLDVFAREGCEINCSIISLMMGGIISVMGPHKGGVVMSWQADSGKGKTTTHRIGEGIFGRPGCLTETGHSSLTSLEHRMVTLCDLPTYMDDIKCPDNPRDPMMKALREFMFFVTEGKSKGRMDRTGTKRITGMLGWNSPVFMTTNKSLPFVLGGGGASTEATFARVLSIRYHTTKLPPDIRVEGVPFNLAYEQNYGKIGRHWLHYIMENMEEVRSNIQEEFIRLQIKSAERNLDHVHRFHNSTIACGLVALRWLKSLGALSWDFDLIQRTMEGFAYSEDEDIQDLAQNDPQNLWTEFLIQHQSNLIKTVPGGSRWEVPDELARSNKGIVIRCYKDKAYIKRITLRKFCNAAGMPPDMLLKWIEEEYGSVFSSTKPMDMAEGTRCPRQTCMFYRVPAEAVQASQEEEDTLNAQPEGSNVVPLRRNKPEEPKAIPSSGW